MKIALLTSFRRMPESYSLVNDVIDQIQLLNKYGHEVVFYSQEGCEGRGIECEKRPVLPHFRLEKNVVNHEAKAKLIDIFKKELSGFDVVITHDLMYLQSYATHRAAIKECGIDVKWIHWAHSGNRDVLDIKMPRAKYIYMNYADLDRWARSLNIELDDARVVFNDKDPALFFNWHPITRQIAEKIDLINNDVMQTYPICSTRMDAKGIDHVIRTFGALKRLGNRVLLVICNSNGRKKKEEIDRKIEFGKSHGLNEAELFFTSTLSEETASQVPRDVVRDLMQISNLFIFPTLSEVCSNILLEASMCKQLIVLNKSFPALFDFGDENKTCLGHPFGSLVRADFSS
ncbi:hypothetical protein KKF82_05260, partial [Patescibacteria group bacterium]|nr:hypothetical protein [Patescibacteria group bacterium]